MSVRLRRGELWFECDDAPPEPSNEAVLGVLLLPAMARGMVLQSEVSVDSTWLEGARRNAARYREWWGYQINPLDRLNASEKSAGTPSAEAGICFTGGVDSFYELLRDPDRFSHLLFIQGPDIPLNDEVRAGHVRAMLDDVASGLGKQVLWVRTNLLEHPFTQVTPWERAHGAGLAAAGHLLRSTIGSLTIAASYGHGRLIPWGSRPDTDPDWSNRTLTVRHGDATKWRQERLAAIASHPLVRRHLRVCTKRRTPTGNCGTCRKCLYTMAQLCALGALQHSEAFGPSVSIADRLNKLSRIEPRMVNIWRNTLDTGDFPADVRDALSQLIARSETAA